MNIDSKLFRFFLRSPWSLLIFFIIPLIVILSVIFHIKLPLAGSKYPLLLNNVCFTLFLFSRFLYTLLGIKKSIRYGSGDGMPRRSVELACPTDAARKTLADAGFLFDTSGNYGEKRETGYLGTVLLYAGLFFVLFTGSLDNLFQFSGTIRDGIGVPTDLKMLDAYKKVSVGPVTTDLSTLPKMRIIGQFFPDDTYPRGATEVVFQFNDGKERTVILKSPEPFKAGAYDIYMSKMVYEPKLAITIDGSKLVFNGRVLLDQLPENENGFSFYGTFAEGVIDGKVYYQPEKSRLRVVVHQGRQQLLDTELLFQKDRLSRSANFAVACETMGVWSEIYVVHRRHMSLIYLGGVLAVIGLLMRVMIRPQRVWLEETGEGCRVRAVGNDAEKRLKAEG
ncbi:MAG: hypothetical protein PHD54_02435 [Desulfuromonadaceae bacterium]|nr:hypothetical protein [Desulfuromonadaceae bacterium]